ncbi:MAG: hypothetical protein CUN56_17240, partial [Phototrophicales bacterium]
ATGTRQGFTLSIDANPVDWAYASVSFSHHETQFVPQPAELTEDFKSKVIHVEPGQQLSYQSHKKRAEHWIIIKGCPEVVLNDKVLTLTPGEHVFIPQGAK